MNSFLPSHFTANITSLPINRHKQHCRPTEEVVTEILGTVKPVLCGHSKIDKTKVLKTNGSLMKV